MTFNGTKLPLKRYRSLGLFAMASAAGLLSGCLDRPVGRTKPETNNIFVKQNPSGGIDKIDILFMVDNSLSMGDKQAVMAAAVPKLLTRLTNPDCVSKPDASGVVQRETLATPTENCPGSLQREFAPVKDIHIGIVTTSLGDYTGDVCPETPAENPTSGFPDQNDHGWLLGGLPRIDPAGTMPDFFSWTKDDAAAYGTAITGKTTEFRNMVTAAAEIGCGLEMSLESWYRFLVDPAPPVEIIQTTPNGYVGRDQGADGRGDVSILNMRREFLRSDSLVAVVMLTDENDCSLKDSRSYSWVPGTSKSNFRMWRASKACATDPNNECCFSCMMVGVDSSIPQRCLDAEPDCVRSEANKLTLDQDQTGLRCKDQKRRFGFDFLFPVTRYSNALSLTTICPDQTFGDLDCDCTEAKRIGAPCDPNPQGKPEGGKVLNPLYTADADETPSGPDREDASAVFFAGIVGVPWQDIATDDVVNAYKAKQAADLKYKLASEIDWNLITPADINTPPTDPLMIESTAPRTGANPPTGFALAPPTAARDANPINGHEWNTGNADLQFACIFSLEQKITEGTVDATRSCIDTEYCANATDARKCARQFVGCSCKGVTDTYAENSPLCQNAAGAYSTKQTSAKAYPGTRQLQALRAFHERNSLTNNAIVGSICPKDLTFANQDKAGYGYNPAVAALVDRLKEKLGGTCLPRPLNADDSGKVPCVITEVVKNEGASASWCDCKANGRDDVDPEMQSAIRGELKRQNKCGGEGQPPCTAYCLCALPELTKETDPNLECLTQANREKSASQVGFCYVDPSQQKDPTLKASEEAIVAACPASEKRLIRIVGGDGSSRNGVVVQPAPAPGGWVFIACAGAAYTGD
jgi:hypothetical protein